jgi:hypothetical protein
LVSPLTFFVAYDRFRPKELHHESSDGSSLVCSFCDLDDVERDGTLEDYGHRGWLHFASLGIQDGGFLL